MRRIGRLFIWLFAGTGFLVVLAVVAVIVFIATRAGPAPMPDRVVLSLDLSGPIAERSTRGFMARLKPRPPALRDITEALQRARDDKRVKAVVARVGGGSMSLATAQAVHGAVRDFREASDKPAIAYAGSLGGAAGNGTVAAYLASGFDTVWLRPTGTVNLMGFALSMPFAREALGDMGVQPQFGRRKAYKSAPETFTRKTISGPGREASEAVVRGWLDQAVAGIAKGRGLDKARVRRLVDNAPVLPAKAKKAGLVDRLEYRPALKKKLDERFDDPGRVGPRGYLAHTEGPDDDAPHIAVIYGVGPVHGGKSKPSPLSGSESIGAQTVVHLLKKAAKADDVKAVILRLDSPGGAFGASDTIRQAVHRTRDAGTPVVASLGSVAASGGYYAAMGADRIVAQPGTLTGSIGVFGGKFDLSGMWDRLGVEWAQIAAGEHAGMWSLNRPFSPGEWERFNAYLDFAYDTFVTKAAEDRGMDKAALEEVARGRVWTGRKARAKGLVDALGGMKRAVKAARDLADIDKDRKVRLVPLPRPADFMETVRQLLKNGGLPVSVRAALMQRLPEPARVLLKTTEAQRKGHILRLPPMAKGT